MKIVRLAMLFGALAEAGFAADPALPPDAYLRAREAALAGVSDTLDQDQIALLSLVAHASAAAALCSGLDLNTEAVKSALADIESAGDMDFHDQALITYGLLTGLDLSEGAQQGEPFCADARALAADREVRPLIIVTNPPPK